MKKINKVVFIIMVTGMIIFTGVLINPYRVVYAEEHTSKKSVFNEYKNNLENSELMKDEEIKDKIDGLYEYINNMKSDVELMNELDPIEYFKSYLESGQGNLSFEKVGGAIVSFLFKEVKTVLSLSISIVVIAIICSLLKNLQASFSNESISNIAFYACYCMLIVILSKSFLVSLTIATDVITKISDFMSALLPILVIMLGSAGGFTQAATMDPIILGATLIIPRIYLNVIIPLILMSFVLQFANNMSSEHKIDNLCKLLKQITLWLQGIILTVFIGLLTVRGITSSTIDAVTLKTAKFAIDNFIPIVGKSFSDAIAAVAGYSLIIKNAISSIGLIVIILLMLYPVLKLILLALVYKLSAALIEPISDKRITSSINAAGESLILIMSCVLSVSLMFFILLAIMASAGKFVIGG
ncbi:stage III sporulation protein AE [Clostridium gasigenes]|uniref:Stage III sporulation protein AE n=1 Tax=Clostridium gasigenes TaxID=94869 RepID=A0A1H0MYZ2_9CLOT|nr:stage III sporulation protein AE [Clostridium gasigenes]MBB6625178.1 stage III sporulation protein AE [Clostridium gasigenes]MBU3087370.1 stage III sporulation protein AE [Clostridium gasigenes]SDO85505.1 stage III sporulation protein AE [Clostridium gasigenes]